MVFEAVLQVIVEVLSRSPVAVFWAMGSGALGLLLTGKPIVAIVAAVCGGGLGLVYDFMT